MSFPRSTGATGARRRQRSIRVSVAILLLILAATVVVVALLLGSLVLVSCAAVLALLCGCASTRIVHSELAQSRRDAANDRAVLAHDYSRLFAKRVAEHDRFASTMTEQVRARDEHIGRLLASTRQAGRRADEAEQRVKREARRNAELQERLDEVSSELDEHRDSLASWDGGEASSVVELLAWEERVAAATAAQPEVRRQA